MLKYQQSLRKSGHLHPQSNLTPAPSNHSASISAIAAQSQALGCARLRGLNVGVRRSSSSSSLPRNPEPTVQIASRQEPTAQEREDQEARELADDKKAVDQELKRYEDLGVTASMPSERMTDLVRAWEVRFYLAEIHCVVSPQALLDQRTCFSFVVSRCYGCSSSAGISSPM
jgi:hypothetical protein